MLLIPQSPHYQHGWGGSTGLFPSNLRRRGSFEQVFINIPIDKHEAADGEKHFAVLHPACQVFGGLGRLRLAASPSCWAPSRAARWVCNGTFARALGHGSLCSCSNCATSFSSAIAVTAARLLETCLKRGAAGGTHVWRGRLGFGMRGGPRVVLFLDESFQAMC